MQHGTEQRSQAEDLGRELEDLIGGRVLAWVGGVAVLLGIVFLLAIGISNGWIGEGMRTALAALGSSALLGAGIWLHERKARTDAALAALAAGVSGLFATVTVATQVYELIPTLAGTVLVVLVGAIATALAVRWESRGIAALGILGALAAPLLAGTSYDGGAVTILFVALAAAAGVLVWQRWSWLALAAFALATPQWVAYLFEGASTSSALATLVAFGALGMVVAVGRELRLRTERIDGQSAFLLALNALVVAGAGWFGLEQLGEPAIGKAWLAGLAVVHVAIGLAGPRLSRVSHDLGLLSIVLGVILADIAFALVAEGPVLAVGWTVTGVAFAALLRRTRASSRDEGLVISGLGSHIALALGMAMTVGDPLDVLSGRDPFTAASAASVGALAAGCLVSARLVGERGEGWRELLDVLGLVAVACLTALALDGTALVLAWICEVAALTVVARRWEDQLAAVGALGFLAFAVTHVLMLDASPELLEGGVVGFESTLVPLAAVGGAALAVGRILPRLLTPEEPLPLRVTLDVVGFSALAFLTVLGLEGERVAFAFAAEAAALACVARYLRDVTSGWAALPFLALAAAHLVVYEVPPVALVTGLTDVPGALLTAVAVTGAATVAAELVGGLHVRLRPVLRGAAALTVLYVGSGLVVTPFESGNAVESTLLSAHQQGQVALSVFWALAGVGTMVVGLRRDVRALRLAALALLGVAATKVFLFDLANLESAYRAVSFIGLGLLLLIGAAVWQRVRPRALADLRETPPGLR